MAAAQFLTKSSWAWWGPWGRTRQRTSCSTWSSRSTLMETAPSSFPSSLNWWNRRPQRCGSLDSNLILPNQYFSAFSFFSRNNFWWNVLGTNPFAFAAGRRCRHNKGGIQDFRPGQRRFHQHQGAEKGDNCRKPIFGWLWDPQTVALTRCQKSEIEKRKKNMESTSRVSRREMRNVKICLLVREENENFCKKKSRNLQSFLQLWDEKEKSKFIFQFREEKEKFCKQFSWFERRSRRRDFKLFVTRKRN